MDLHVTILLCNCVLCSRCKGSKTHSWAAGLGPLNGIGGQQNRVDTEDEVVLQERWLSALAANETDLNAECVVQALHSSRSSCRIQSPAAFKGSLRPVCMFVVTYIYANADTLAQKSDECSNSGRKWWGHRMICVPQYFVVWPWEVFTDTGSVLEIGMRQIDTVRSK